MDLTTGNLIADLQRWRDFFLSVRRSKNRSERTIAIYDGVLGDFIEYARRFSENNQMGDINLGFVSGYFNEKLVAARDGKIKFGKSTHVLHYDVLNSFLTFITEQNYDSVTLTRGMKELKVKPEVKPKVSYTKHEYERVLSVLEDLKERGKRELTTYRNVLLFKIVLFTGIRAAEMASLRLNDAVAMDHVEELPDGSEKRAEIFRFMVKGKGNKTRDVAIDREAILEEMEYLARRIPEDSLIAFSSTKGTPLGPLQISRIFSRLARKAGVSKRGAHILRHTFAQDLVDRGENLHTISLMLGHSSPAVTSKFYAGKAERARVGAALRVGEARKAAVAAAKKR